MKNAKLCTSILFASLSIATVPLLSACVSAPSQESAGQYVDSSAITAKVKAKLLADDDVKSFDITVNTFKNDVQLSGFVSTGYQKHKAAQLARSVHGVTAVQNDLIVK